MSFDPVFSAALRRELERVAQAGPVQRPVPRVGVRAGMRVGVRFGPRVGVRFGVRFGPRVGPRVGLAARLLAAGAVLVLVVLAVPAMGQLSSYLRGFSSHAGSGVPTLVATPSQTPTTTTTPTPTTTPSPSVVPSVSPGMAVITPLAAPVTVTLSGTHTVDLGTRPADANGFTFTFECLTAGKFGLGTGGASVSCGTRDAGRHSGQTGSSTPETLAAGQHSYTITAAAEDRWTLTTTYVEWHYSDWAINAKGETYGVGNDRGEPDLVYVAATNGKAGYAYSKDLGGPCAQVKSPAEALSCQKENAGKTTYVPVYESDGETVIGQFREG